MLEADLKSEDSFQLKIVATQNEYTPPTSFVRSVPATKDGIVDVEQTSFDQHVS
jgi:hypothetical protein